MLCCSIKQLNASHTWNQWVWWNTALRTFIIISTIQAFHLRRVLILIVSILLAVVACHDENLLYKSALARHAYLKRILRSVNTATLQVYYNLYCLVCSEIPRAEKCIRYEFFQAVNMSRSMQRLNRRLQWTQEMMFHSLFNVTLMRLNLFVV